MSTETSEPKASDNRFDSLDAIEREHTLLVNDLKSLLATAEGSGRVLRFLSRAAATGSILDARDDRTSAQGLINFWAAKLATAARSEDGDAKRNVVVKPKFEETLLAEFDPSTVSMAASAADRWLAGLQPQDQAVARCVLLRLVRLGPDGQTFEPVPTSRAALYDVLPSSEAVDRVITELAKMRVIRVTRGDSSDAERVQLATKALLTSWGTYKKWLDKRRAFRELAESWNRAGRSADKLLKGEELEEAQTYQDRNAAERKLIDDSRYIERQKNERDRLLKSVFGILAIVALSGWGVSAWYYKMNSELADARRMDAEHSRNNMQKKTIDLEKAQDELTNTNKELDRKNSELEAIVRRIRYSKEQALAKEAQVKAEESRVENRPAVSTALARDPELKGQWRLWKNGAVLRIRFLDGDDKVKGLVKKYAPEWTQHANLNFDFGSDPKNAPIRITFAQPGSWSALGTDALTVMADQPTTNLGLVQNAVDEEDAARVIRHEFGHVLGLIHEQKSPNAKIRWNREAVMKYYGGPPNNWPPSVIEDTILNVFPKFEDPEYRPFDPQSIMMFPIPEGLAEGLVVDWHTKLSESDKRFAAQLYPGREDASKSPR
ncbi:MAG: peptidase M12 [Isosphaerales bacterium]